MTQEQPEASSTARKSAKAARTPQAQPRRCDPRWRRDLAADLLGLAGVGSLGVGLAMIHHAAALITLGALSLAAGIMLARNDRPPGASAGDHSGSIPDTK